MSNEDTLIEMKVEELTSRSTLRRLAGKTGLKIKPFYGWSFLVGLTYFLTVVLYVAELCYDFGNWLWYTLGFLAGTGAFVWAVLIVAINRQLDKQEWIHLGNLGRFPLTKTAPLGHHEQTIDMQSYLAERSVFVQAGMHLMKVVRDLWQPGGVAAGAGMDGGKEMGHAAPIRLMQVSDDGGKSWLTIYRHPLLKLGDTYVFFQFFVATPAVKLPEGMLTEVVHAYEEDVTTGEVAIAEGFYHFGTMDLLTAERKVELPQLLDDILFPTGQLPAVPALGEIGDLRAENFRLRGRTDELQSDLSRRTSYERDEMNG